MRIDCSLVNISIPASGHSYDVYLPRNVKLANICEMVAKLLGDLSEGYFLNKGECVLCDKDTGDIYNKNLTIEQLGIKNGHKLFLV